MKTKIRARKRRVSGFTLMELIIVIAIIALLAALSFAGFQHFIITSNYKKAEGQMEALKTGINRYRTENAEPPRPASGLSEKESSRAVYQALWGDGDNALQIGGGSGSSESTGRTGSTSETYITNMGVNETQMISNSYLLVDPFDQPYFYKIYDENDPDPKMHNKSPGGYDLWSIGNDTSPGGNDYPKWITSW